MKVPGSQDSMQSSQSRTEPSIFEVLRGQEDGGGDIR